MAGLCRPASGPPPRQTAPPKRGRAPPFEDLLLHLAAVVADVPLAAVYRHVDAGDEELLLRDEAAVFKVLLHAVHGAAALLADERVQEVVAALEGALQYALGIGT